MKNSVAGQCPVCAMKVESSQYQTQYHKMYFHFCSEQCLETFAAMPQFYASGAVERRTPVLKHRSLRLAGRCAPEALQVIVARLREMMGVTEVYVQDDRLQISYDLLQVKLVRIEQRLNELEVPLDNGWWQQVRRGWTRNSEENELANLARRPGACCNRPPAGA